jgi:Fic family protein
LYRKVTCNIKTLSPNENIIKEGTKSSRIEGTQTNIDEAVQKESFVNPEKKDDWQEVQNYVLAMNTAIHELQKLPLSNRLLRQTHKILLLGVRGKHKQAGEFRNSQNWIGGSSLSDAKFIPPHQDGVSDYMGDLEKFIHNPNTNLPHLIKIGLLHYQFETIHPFLDGNGKIGRLLITLYLVSNGLLVKPTLYLSDFFEKNKEHYYDNLTIVRSKNDLEQWLKFFLEGVRVTAENSIQTFKNIIDLRNELDTKIISLGKRQLLAKKVLQYLYSEPITDLQSIAEATETSFTAISRLLKDFLRLEILVEITGYKRNRVFVFEPYMKLFR